MHRKRAHFLARGWGQLWAEKNTSPSNPWESPFLLLLPSMKNTTPIIPNLNSWFFKIANNYCVILRYFLCLKCTQGTWVFNMTNNMSYPRVWMKSELVHVIITSAACSVSVHGWHVCVPGVWSRHVHLLYHMPQVDQALQSDRSCLADYYLEMFTKDFPPRFVSQEAIDQGKMAGSLDLEVTPCWAGGQIHFWCVSQLRSKRV